MYAASLCLPMNMALIVAGIRFDFADVWGLLSYVVLLGMPAQAKGAMAMLCNMPPATSNQAGGPWAVNASSCQQSCSSPQCLTFDRLGQRATGEFWQQVQGCIQWGALDSVLLTGGSCASAMWPAWWLLQALQAQ